MTKINGGATLWARQTTDSDIFYKKPHVWFKIWFYLINQAKHKDNKQFRRGSCFMKYEWIMEKTKAKKSEVDHCIRWLKSATMITTAKATRGFIVKVNKYDPFQSLENYKSDTKSDSKSDLKAKQKRNKSETKATLLYKNDNNGINGKNDKNGERRDSVKHHTILREQIINYLNTETGKHYLLTTSLTIKLIKARLKEGYSLDDFKKVIDVKIEEWKGRFTKDGKNMEDWLRPQTLFGNKFESYLNQNNRINDPNRFDFIDEEEKLIE